MRTYTPALALLLLSLFSYAAAAPLHSSLSIKPHIHRPSSTAVFLTYANTFLHASASNHNPHVRQSQDGLTTGPGEEDGPDAKDADKPATQKHRGIIIGVAVGVGVLLLIVVVLLFVWYRNSSARASEDSYYKFDLNSADLAAGHAESLNIHKSRTASNEKLARAGFGSGIYIAGPDLDEVIAKDRPRHHHGGRKKKAVSSSKKKTNNCSFTSTEGISAPRAEAHEVPSAGVAFLDDAGRPIPTL